MHFHSREPLHITSNGDIKFKVAADITGEGGEDGIIIKSNVSLNYIIMVIRNLRALFE